MSRRVDVTVRTPSRDDASRRREEQVGRDMCGVLEGSLLVESKLAGLAVTTMWLLQRPVMLSLWSTLAANIFSCSYCYLNAGRTPRAWPAHLLLPLVRSCVVAYCDEPPQRFSQPFGNGASLC